MERRVRPAASPQPLRTFAPLTRLNALPRGAGSCRNQGLLIRADTFTVRTRVCACVHVRARGYVHVRARVYVCMHTCVLCTCTGTCVYMQVCVCARVFGAACNLIIRI